MNIVWNALLSLNSSDLQATGIWLETKATESLLNLHSGVCVCI